MSRTRPGVWIVLVLVVAVCLFAFASREETPVRTEIASAVAAPAITSIASSSPVAKLEVDRATFEGRWPLVDDSVTVTCERTGSPSRPVEIVTVQTDRGRFALSGTSRHGGRVTPSTTPLPKSEWLDDEGIPGAKVSIGDLAQAARDLCKV